MNYVFLGALALYLILRVTVQWRVARREALDGRPRHWYQTRQWAPVVVVGVALLIIGVCAWRIDAGLLGLGIVVRGLYLGSRHGWALVPAMDEMDRLEGLGGPRLETRHRSWILFPRAMGVAGALVTTGLAFTDHFTGVAIPKEWFVFSVAMTVVGGAHALIYWLAGKFAA